MSIGWMNAQGGRDFEAGEGRAPPVVSPQRTGDRTIFLADYQGKIERADTVRLHPAQQRPSEPLEVELDRHDVAIGYRTTALVTAGLMGLAVLCRDDTNIMARPNWLELLPWADWHFSEIENGEAWEHLRSSLPQRSSR